MTSTQVEAPVERFPGPRLLALLSVLVVVPVVAVGLAATTLAAVILLDDGVYLTTVLGVVVLVLLGWSPAIAGRVTWWLLRRRGHDRRGAWGGVLAVAAIALAVVPSVLFVLYLLTWAIGSVFFY